MKFYYIFFLLLSPFLSVPDLAQIREDYKMVSNNSELASGLWTKLKPVTKENNVVLVAYKGAVTALMAKYTAVPKRKNRFKEGVQLLEYAVSQDPNNIEIRCLRLSIQENTPKFLKYRSNIEDDRTFILDHYKNTPSLAVKDFVKSYVLRSTGFNTEEKQGL
jgi:hypothetical protein